MTRINTLPPPHSNLLRLPSAEAWQLRILEVCEAASMSNKT
jgi:hypothetical protein